MVPERHYTDLRELLQTDFRSVLHGYPNWYSEPVRDTIDRLLTDVGKVIADHKEAGRLA
jgi:hypothetical protein